MKLGFSTVIYEPYGLDLSQMMERASRYRYQGIELNFKERPEELDWAWIKGLTETHGVEVAAIGTRHMLLQHGLYLSSPNPKVRERGVEYIRKCMELADRWGTHIIQAGWAFQGARLEAGYDEVWGYAVESLKKVARHAEDYGKILVIEVANRFETQLLNTLEQGMKILQEVGSEEIALMADTFHMNIEEAGLGESIRGAGSKIRYVHIADSNRLAPGWGHTDFREIIEALKEIGYKGYLIMEFIPKPDPDTALQHAIEYMRKMI
jgi:sugar phosphate isomerase/epimerase